MGASASPGFIDLLQYLLSFAFVIALMLGLLYALRKLQQGGGMHARTQRMKIIESMSVGARQKIVLLRLDDQEVVLGVTPTEITALHTQAAGGHEALSTAPPSAEGFQFRHLLASLK